MAEAEGLYRRAAELGDAYAMVHVGFGQWARGGEDNLAESERLYRRAAELGHSKAMFNLAALRRQVEERLAAGQAWSGGDDPHLWTDELGEPIRPDTMSAAFTDAQAGLDVPRITMHGTRHTSATLAIDAGVPVHVLSKRLGHSSVAVTMGLYVHSLPDQEADAAERIGGALYRAEGS